MSRSAEHKQTSVPQSPGSEQLLCGWGQLVVDGFVVAQPVAKQSRIQVFVVSTNLSILTGLWGEQSGARRNEKRREEKRRENKERKRVKHGILRSLYTMGYLKLLWTRTHTQGERSSTPVTILHDGWKPQRAGQSFGS